MNNMVQLEFIRDVTASNLSNILTFLVLLSCIFKQMPEILYIFKCTKTASPFCTQFTAPHKLEIWRSAVK